MAEGDYVEGLSGEEIINDVLDQLGEKMHGDCNLRELDSYPGGYEGTVEYHLRLRGMDTAEIKETILVGSPASKPQEDAAVKVAEGKLEIELEPELNVVRERSGQDVPTLSRDEEGRPIVQKRQYRRRIVDASAPKTLSIES